MSTHRRETGALGMTCDAPLTFRAGSERPALIQFFDEEVYVWAALVGTSTLHGVRGVRGDIRVDG